MILQEISPFSWPYKIFTEGGTSSHDGGVPRSVRGNFMAKLLLQKVYTVSKKHSAPRLWLQHLVCETAQFKPGEDLFVRVDEDEKTIVIQNKPFEEEGDVHEIHVSSRVNRISGEPRPLVDTCGVRYTSVLCVQDKIEISVYRHDGYSQVIVRPLRYRLFEEESFEAPSDQRISLLSLCAGAGIGTAIFCDTQAYTAVMEVEIEEDSASVLKHNFPHSYLFNGDLRDCHITAKADVAFVTLSCTESSTLGDGGEGYFDNVILGSFKILKSAEPRVIFFENVPSFYNSRPFKDLRELLSTDYPYWVGPIRIDSYHFGSIAKRDRSYALCMREREDFESFRIPEPPAFRRKKLKEYLDPKGTEHEWKPLDKWMASFQSKAEKNNSWADRSIEKTFVDPDTCTQLQCIPRRYRSHSASNSYVLNEDQTKWRFLSVSELRRIFEIPDWFEFPKHIPVYRIYEMIGQSVCGRVIRAFANEIATMFFRRYAKQTQAKRERDLPFNLTMDNGGQIGFLI